MTEVFISYARADQAIARRTASALQKAGFDVWWDADLPAHRAYSDVIEKHLEEAKAVVVLWSRLSAKSEWVRAEADFARARHKLVQAGLDGSLPPIPFNQVQCADLKGWRGSTGHPGWSKLKQSVAALVSGEEPVRTEAAAPRWWSQRRFQLAAAFGALLLLAALWLVPRWLGADEGKRPVVAVLPFESLDHRDASLVAGIWEDTRQALARNPRLLVLGPNTSQKLGEQSGTASRAADYLVEASVRSAGDRIRVSASLVRTNDNAQMWSESFDRRLDDVFQLQQQIAGEIEGRVRGRLADRGGTLPEHIVTSGEVYALYSEARANIRDRRIGKYTEAQKQLEDVVRRDPNFAPGWATLAVAKVLFGTGSPQRPGEADARRAIALAPNLAAGHAALGLALGPQSPAAKAALRRALELDPNDIEAMNWLANAFHVEGNRQAASELRDRILEIEPLWWPAILNRVDALTDVGDLAAAQKEIARLDKLGDTFTSTLVKMHLANKKGDLSTAVNLGLERYRAGSHEEREMMGNLLFLPLAQLELFDIADRLSPPVTPWIPYIRRNDPKAIDMFEAEIKPSQFWTFGHLGIVGARIYLMSNQPARLVKLYRGAAASPEEFTELVGKERIADTAPIVALALKRTGDEAEARRLLDIALENAEEAQGTAEDQQVRLARIHAVEGRRDQAINLLSEAVRRGWIPPYLPIHVDIALDPPLAELKGDRRFQALRQRILRHLAKERAELGAITLN